MQTRALDSVYHMIPGDMVSPPRGKLQPAILFSLSKHNGRIMSFYHVFFLPMARSSNCLYVTEGYSTVGFDFKEDKTELSRLREVFFRVET
jgi:hypothetical protein